MNEDRIAREIEIAAPVDRVWAVLTEPEHIATWFGTGTPNEIDLRPGGIMVLDHGPHGRYPTRLVTVSPPHVLSYRWAASYPGAVADDDNSTLVEFTLTPIPSGTLLQVTESGFASLDIPEDRAEVAGFEDHSDGWPRVLQRLADVALGITVEPLAASR